MKIISKLAVAACFAAVSSLCAKADYLAWSITDPSQDYDYAQIYYASDANSAGTANSTLLTSYLDNTGENGFDRVSKDSADYFAETGEAFLADISGLSNLSSTGYKFYVLLYSDNEVLKVSDPIAYDTAKTVAAFNQLSQNQVNSSTVDSNKINGVSGFNIPEPTSGLLLLLGSAAMLLRRKRA